MPQTKFVAVYVAFHIV
uniref:Uncharacterized protein n=1 Tax=Megaselia scalaris TaxID=36166 RepID=T1GBV9_MEGSC